MTVWEQNGMKSKNVMLCGGLGYIGSHVALELLKTTNYNVYIIDNQVNSSDEILDILPITQEQRFRLHYIDSNICLCDTIKNKKFLNYAFRVARPFLVINLCAHLDVAESMTNPLKYYGNNVGGCIRLLKMMKKYNVTKYIFSSTAAVYAPSTSILTEESPIGPISPYGSSKYMCEDIIRSCKDVKSVVFRFFNVAGSNIPNSLSSQFRKNELTHLIPRILKDKSVKIYGNDYPTKDGTCVRDYIHVQDIARAHILAINYLEREDFVDNSVVLNLGNGQGHTVYEIAQVCQSILALRSLSPESFNIEFGDRRDGDLPVVVASNTKALNVIGWAPELTLHQMISSMITTPHSVK